MCYGTYRLHKQYGGCATPTRGARSTSGRRSEIGPPPDSDLVVRPLLRYGNRNQSTLAGRWEQSHTHPAPRVGRTPQPAVLFRCQRLLRWKFKKISTQRNPKRSIQACG